MTPLQLICRALVAGGLAGARPTLMLLIVLVSIVIFSDASALPEDFRWLVHQYALIAIAAFVIVEYFARTDPDMEELLELPNAVISAGVAALLPALLPALDVSVDGLEIPGLTPDEPGDGSTPTVNASLFDGQIFKVVIAMAAALLTFWLKRRVVTALSAASISQRYYRWLETGAIVGAMAALVLVPALTVLLAVVVVASSVALGTTVWFVQRRLDRRARRPCPHCDYGVRREALLCPECRTELEPQQRLG